MLKHMVSVLYSLPLTLGLASVIFWSEVLDILSRMNATMQKKDGDFSKLPVFLKATADQLEHLKDEKSKWLKSVESEIPQFKEKHDVTL